MKFFQEFFIYIWTSHLVDEIAFSSNDLLQPGPEGAAGPLGGIPEDVAEDLFDGGDQGLFLFVRGSVNTSPRYATLQSNGLISREQGGQTFVP